MCTLTTNVLIAIEGKRPKLDDHANYAVTSKNKIRGSKYTVKRGRNNDNFQN